MTDVIELNRLESLAEHRQDWDALLGQTPSASLFHTLDWLEIYWRHYGADQRLRTLIVREDGQAVGILPLVVTPEWTRLGTIRVLTYPLHSWGSYYGPIGPDGPATLRAGLDYLRQTPRDWDLLELRWVGAPGTDPAASGQAMRTCGLQGVEGLWHHTALVDLRGDWQGYLAARTSKWRNNLNRWQRKLAARGKVEYSRYRPRGESQGESDPRWDLYGACEELARRSWQGSSADGTTLSHDSVRPFLREVHATAARLGAVDVNLLSLDGEPLAFAYNYWWNGTGYGLRIGYDAQQSRDGAGNLLYAKMIEDSFRRGDRWHDLGIGSLDIKRQFLTDLAAIYRYSHFPLGAPRAQILRLKRWLSRENEETVGGPDSVVEAQAAS